MAFYYQSHGKEAPNAFVKYARKIYRPLGFQKGYNFPLWVIFGGAALGFCAARAMYLNFYGIYFPAKVISGEEEWQNLDGSRYKVAIIMHLITVIPIGFLLPWQFLPVVRHKLMLFHRLNGYLLLTLLLGANISAMIMADKALGGTIETRCLIGVLAIVSVGSGLMAYINIKRLQIDQHRAWMLRCWGYSFLIVTLRLIQLFSIPIISSMSGLYYPMACSTIENINKLTRPGLAREFFPECENNPDHFVAVRASLNAHAVGDGPKPLHEIGAAIEITFPLATVLSLFLHVILVEIYLKLTPAEANRLKRVSYERQLAAGFKHPGDAGITIERWGDADAFDYGLNTKAPDQDKVEARSSTE